MQVEIYLDEAKTWQWRIRNCRNMKIVGMACGGFKKRSNCVSMAKKLFPNVSVVNVE